MKNWLIYLGLIIFAFGTIGTLSANDLPMPPKAEPTPLFNFEPFERQPEIPAYIFDGLKNLEQKKRNAWTGKDSLFYAIELTLLGKYEQSLNYFIRVKTDTISNLFSLRAMQFTFEKTERYNRLLSSLEQELLLSPKQSSAINFRKELIIARQNQKEQFLRLDDFIVFPSLSAWLPDSNGNIATNNKKQAALIASHLDQALRSHVLFSDNVDKILAKAYTEFGDFLYYHLHVSNAYIAYSIARHFDKRNNEASKQIKETKDFLNTNNFLYPSVLSVFKKIDESNYRFQTYQELDPLDIQIMNNGKYPELDELLAESNIRKDYLPWLDFEVAFIFILLILLLFILFFVRTPSQ